MDDIGRQDPRRPRRSRPRPSARPWRTSTGRSTSGSRPRVRPGDVVVFYFAGQATRQGRRDRGAGRAGRTSCRSTRPWPTSSGPGFVARRRPGPGRRSRRKAQGRDLARHVAPRAGAGRGLPPEKGAPIGLDWLRSLTRWPGVTAWLAADGRPPPRRGRPARSSRPLMKAIGHARAGPQPARHPEGAPGRPRPGDRGFRTRAGSTPAALALEGRRPADRGGRARAGRPVRARRPGDLDPRHGRRLDPDLRRARTRPSASGSLADRSLPRTLAEPLGGVEALALNRDNTILVAGDGLGRIIGWDMACDRPKRLYGPTGHERGDPRPGLPARRQAVRLARQGARLGPLGLPAAASLRKIGAFSAGGSPGSSPRAGPTPAPRRWSRRPRRSRAGRATSSPSTPRASRSADSTGPAARIAALDLSADGRQPRLRRRQGAGGPPRPGEPAGRLSTDRSTGRSAWPGSRSPASCSSPTARLAPPDRAPGRRPGGDPGRPEGGGGPGRGRPRRVLGRRPMAGRLHRRRGADLRLAADRPGPALARGPARRRRRRAISPAFSPDGRTLVVGDADGGIRSWRPRGRRDGARGRAPAADPRRRRGKVAELAPSPSGRYLLEDHQGRPRPRLGPEEGEAASPCPGSWLAGAFLPDESKLVLATRPDEGERGGTSSSSTGPRAKVLPLAFERPTGAGRQAVEGGVRHAGRLEVGPMVAGGEPGGATAAGLRLAGRGRPARPRRPGARRRPDGGRPLGRRGVPPDRLRGRHGQALAPGRGRGRAAPGRRRPSSTPARRRPGDHGRPVLPGRARPGRHRDPRGGYVFLWDWAEGKAGPGRRSARLDGEVNALAFSADGRWLVASGARDKSIRFWSIPEAGPPQAVAFRPRPHHGEQVGALAAWPDGSMIVSGGDDAAVRFWDLKDHALVGTLVAQAREPTGASTGSPSRPKGSSTARCPARRWSSGGSARRSSPSSSRRTPTTSSSSPRPDRQGASSPRPARAPGRGPPAEDRRPARRSDRRGPRGRADALVRRPRPDPASGSTRTASRSGATGDFRPGPAPTSPDPGRAPQGREPVLRDGLEARPLDGQSDEVTLRYDGPEPPGRLHTLAIGISNYAERPLKYAHADAQTIADFLHDRGVQGVDRPGERIVLIDDEVNARGDRRRLPRSSGTPSRASPRTPWSCSSPATPTPTTKTDQFCLLLPDFPFEAPRRPPVAAPGNVGASGGTPGGGRRALVGDPDVLPYVVLYNRLARLEALQRLVIVNACQAGAILEDPAVRNIQRLVERGRGRPGTRTSWPPAGASPPTRPTPSSTACSPTPCSRGWGPRASRPIPADLGGFPGPPSADLNRDGLVSTDELVAYADETLPRLARMFPQLVLRAGAGPLDAQPRPPARARPRPGAEAPPPVGRGLLPPDRGPAPGPDAT